jgi:hypothetical protein
MSSTVTAVAATAAQRTSSFTWSTANHGTSSLLSNAHVGWFDSSRARVRDRTTSFRV